MLIVKKVYSVQFLKVIKIIPSYYLQIIATQERKSIEKILEDCLEKMAYFMKLLYMSWYAHTNNYFVSRFLWLPV